MTIHTTMKIEVRETDVVDALDAAGYGIGYWASEAVINDGAEQYRVTVQDEHVGELNGGPNPTEVSFSRIVQAMVELVETTDWATELRAFLTEGDAGELDSAVMDAVVQQAIFGEILFG